MSAASPDLAKSTCSGKAGRNNGKYPKRQSSTNTPHEECVVSRTAKNGGTIIFFVWRKMKAAKVTQLS